MWSAYPAGWFSRRFRVEDRGRLVGHVEIGFWTRSGGLELGERRLAIHRHGVWRPTYRLSEEGWTVATAVSSGAFQRAIRIVHDKETYRLGRSSFFGRTWDLTRNGRFLGQLRSHGLTWRRTTIDLNEELPPELRLFAYWLLVQRRRRASAAAGSA